MQQDRTTSVATAIVIGTGALWGFYWLPVRGLSQLGLAGAWGTLAITLAAMILLLPFVAIRRRGLGGTDPVALIFIALGGVAFALYSVGFVYGRVAIIILLYFLTPVWSTLIARFVMGWETPPLRILAILVGLAGLGLMLGADGDWPLPRGMGEWMALLAGVIWSIATTGIKARSDLAPVEATFVFACGAALAAGCLAPMLGAWPVIGTIGDLAKAAGLALLTGGFWWGLSIAALMWATVRLEPARVGILLMAEVLVGAASGALIADESLSLIEVAGGTLVLCAGILEVWPVKRGRPGTAS